MGDLGGNTLEIESNGVWWLISYIGDEGGERAIFLAWVTGSMKPYTEVKNTERGTSLGLK